MSEPHIDKFDVNFHIYRYIVIYCHVLILNDTQMS